GQQQERLEDEADEAAARPAPRRAPQRAHVLVGEPDLARVGVLEQAEQVQQRALARAGRARDDDEVPGLDVHVHAVEHRNAGPGGSPMRLHEAAGAQHHAPRRIASAGDRRTTRSVAYSAATAPSSPAKITTPARRRAENRKSCWPRLIQRSIARPSAMAITMPVTPPDSVTASDSVRTSRPSCASVAPSARLT